MENSILTNSHIYARSNNVGIFTNTPDYNLDVNGDLNTSQEYKISNNIILSGSTLGTSIINSSLTSLDTLQNIKVTGGSTFTTIYVLDSINNIWLGTQGFQGIKGNQGFIGIRGFQGNQGFIGNQGSVGFQGFQGVLGNQGILGNQGVLGNQGYQGYGIQGNSNGFQGNQGNQGSIIGLTVSCSSFLIQGTTYSNTPFTWNNTENPYGSIYNSISYSGSTLNISISGLYSYMVWSPLFIIGSGGLVGYIAIDGVSQVQSKIANIFYGPQGTVVIGNPLSWSGIINLSAGSIVQFGLGMNTNSSLTANISSTNKAYLHLFLLSKN